MSLQAPAALALAAALPVIVALWLLRPRRTRVRVPSLLLWSGADVERHSARPWQRLRHHPLLWLQLLVATLLVAAAVRPFLPAAAASQHVVLLLDASGSMRAVDVAPDRFAVACERAREVARSLGPGQRLSLVRVDEDPRVLVAGAGADEVERALAGQEAGYGAPDFARAFELAEGVAPGAAEWVLVTDGAFDATGGARLTAGAALRTVAVAPPQPGGNVAITALRTRAEGERVSVQAGILNAGMAPASGRVVLAAEGALVASEPWTLAPGEERYVAWSGLPATGHWYEAHLAEVDAAANALAHDDRAWAATPGGDDRRLLLVSDGNTFLERAFAVLGGTRADRVSSDGWQAIAAGEAPYDVVVFDGEWPAERPPGNALLFGHPTADKFRPQRIEPDATHPLLRYVDWSDVSIGAAQALPLDESWDVVVDSPGGPLLAVREAGGRREAAFAFNLSGTDLALRPAFPVLLANVIEWLAPREGGGPLSAAPGEPVRIDPGPLTERLRVEDSAGRVEELAPPWPPAPYRAPAPGLYRVLQEGPGGQQERLLITGGYQPSEASIAPRTSRFEGGGGAARAGAPATALSLWPWLAAAVLVAAMVEWWLDARGR